MEMFPYIFRVYALLGICTPVKLRVMTFNIWNSGSHVTSGLQKVAKHIILVDPDIVALQEVKGKNVILELLSLLGEPWTGIFDKESNSDVSIFTKHQILMQTYTNTNRSIGVRIALGSGHLISFWSVHLDYKSFGPYAANNKMVTSLDQILTGENPKEGAGRQQNMLDIEANPQMQHWLSKSEMIPVILAGDFNSPSHIDWTEETIDKHGNWAVEWPATKILDNMGFIDSFRAVHPNISSVPGHTWSTVNKFTAGWEYKIPEPQDRIDFIFFKGNIDPIDSFLYSGAEPLKSIPNHRENDYPSDHFAVVTEFKFIEYSECEQCT